MLCVKCKGKCKVVDSREAGDHVTRRRYECKECLNRFTSYEQLRDFSSIDAIPARIYKVLKKKYTDKRILELGVDFMMQTYISKTYNIELSEVQQEFDTFRALKLWKRNYSI